MYFLPVFICVNAAAQSNHSYIQSVEYQFKHIQTLSVQVLGGFLATQMFPHLRHRSRMIRKSWDGITMKKLSVSTKGMAPAWARATASTQDNFLCRKYAKLFSLFGQCMSPNHLLQMQDDAEACRRIQCIAHICCVYNIYIYTLSKYMFKNMKASRTLFKTLPDSIVQTGYHGQREKGPAAEGANSFPHRFLHSDFPDLQD